MGQYLNETHSLAGRRPARPPHITHEQLVCFFQASNGMSRMNRVFAVYSRYSGIHAHIHQLNHRFMGTLARVFFYSSDLDVMPARNIILFFHVWSDQ